MTFLVIPMVAWLGCDGGGGDGRVFVVVVA